MAEEKITGQAEELSLDELGQVTGGAEASGDTGAAAGTWNNYKIGDVKRLPCGKCSRYTGIPFRCVEVNGEYFYFVCEQCGEVVWVLDAATPMWFHGGAPRNFGNAQ
jgi:hypothetical protein